MSKRKDRKNRYYANVSNTRQFDTVEKVSVIVNQYMQPASIDWALEKAIDCDVEEFTANGLKLLDDFEAQGGGLLLFYRRVYESNGFDFSSGKIPNAMTNLFRAMEGIRVAMNDNLLGATSSFHVLLDEDGTHSLFFSHKLQTLGLRLDNGWLAFPLANTDGGVDVYVHTDGLAA